MSDLTKNNDFFNGVLFGFKLYQSIVITTHKRKEPLKIGDELYFFQSGRERLQEMVEKICK